MFVSEIFTIFILPHRKTISPQKQNDMAKIIHKIYNQNDSLLLPPSLGELIPTNHPVRVVNDILDRFDISEIESTYKSGGTSSYHPRMLLKVVVYAYLCNVYSGRQMERSLCENIHFMWLGGMNRPDFRTINRFRSERLSGGKLESIFTKVVELLSDEGFVSLNVQYIDGTKIESVANKYTFVWKGSVEKNKAKLIEKVRGVLSSAEEELAIEEATEVPDELPQEEFERRANNILSKMDSVGISKGKQRRSVEKTVADSVGKLNEYDRHLDTLGKRNSYSKTDPDATFMRMKEDAMNNGQTKPGYNVQISTENQFITNYGIYWRPTDTGTMIDYLESFKARYGRQSKEIVADSGYGSEQNYEYMFGEGITPYVKYNMFHAEMKRTRRENPFLVENMFYNAEKDFYVCPMGQHLEFAYKKEDTSDLGYISTKSVYISRNCSKCPLRGMCYKGKIDRRTIEVNHRNNHFRAKARELLMSEEGLMHRSKRPIEPEAVFGNIKFNHGFKRFRLKSTEKVSVEWGLVAIAHNLRKYIACKQGNMSKKMLETSLVEGYMNGCMAA